MFPHLQNKKINQVQKIISGSNIKSKSQINMTIKRLSHKQVIVLMNNELAKKYLKDLSIYIVNINHTLKNIKSNTMANFIRIENKSIVISTNNVANPSDLQEIEKCIKNSLNSDIDQISSPRLPQLKSYLKIVGISYLVDQSNYHKMNYSLICDI